MARLDTLVPNYSTSRPKLEGYIQTRPNAWRDGAREWSRWRSMPCSGSRKDLGIQCCVVQYTRYKVQYTQEAGACRSALASIELVWLLLRSPGSSSLDVISFSL